MASPTVNVARYSALIFGILYGIVHQNTLQAKYDENKATKAQARRAHLIEEARAAYAKKKADEAAGLVVTDPESPNFDLEKLVNSWAEAKL
ncbi:F1F0 ATP synthase subunit e, mitochondrial [Naganishia albida]|nr:F1F0 ATP synthase subunit e, mitochondrial [Naganishia albida]